MAPRTPPQSPWGPEVSALLLAGAAGRARRKTPHELDERAARGPHHPAPAPVARARAGVPRMAGGPIAAPRTCCVAAAAPPSPAPAPAASAERPRPPGSRRLPSQCGAAPGPRATPPSQVECPRPRFSAAWRGPTPPARGASTKQHRQHKTGSPATPQGVGGAGHWTPRGGLSERGLSKKVPGVGRLGNAGAVHAAHAANPQLVRGGTRATRPTPVPGQTRRHRTRTAVRAKARSAREPPPLV